MKMEFAKVYGSNMKRANGMYGMGMVRSSSFGRKRVSFSNMEFGAEDDCMTTAPLKRLCSLDSFPCTEKPEFEVFQKPVIEDLPQEILIRILCGVEHDDLKRLFFVSKAIREAAVIAKKSHFAFSTPRKTVGFKYVGDFGCFNNGVETPNAPKRSRVPRSRLTAKKLNQISVDLFAGDGEEDSPKGGLFVEMEQ